MVDMIKVDKIGVHATHCCKKCGCKYGDPDCPVELGTVVALFDCEDCESRLNSLVEDLNYCSTIELIKVAKQLTPLTRIAIREILLLDL
jgi:hypothetical protein